MSIFSKWFSGKKTEEPASVEPQKPQCSATDYCEQGQKSLDASKYVEAMEYFQAAIEVDKHFEKAYLLLSVAYEKQGKTDKAKTALYGLLAIDPNNKEALKGLEQLNQPEQKTVSNPIASIAQGQMQSSIIATSFSTSNTISVNSQSAPKVNYRIFDGKDSDYFDFFIIFDDGNRLYFKTLNSNSSNVSVVAPSKKDGYWGGMVWSGYKRPIGAVEIPSSIEHYGKKYEVKEIGESAFASCSQIQSVIIPDSVTTILGSAFKGCHSLRNVRLSSTLESIGVECFRACSFSHIDIPDSVMGIECGAFSLCQNLTAFQFPNSLTIVKSRLLVGCRNLNSIVIPGDVKEIEDYAFGDDFHLDGLYGNVYGSDSITLIVKSIVPPKIGEAIVQNHFYRQRKTPIKVCVFVPKGAIDAYMIAQYWQLFDIKEM